MSARSLSAGEKKLQILPTKAGGCLPRMEALSAGLWQLCNKTKFLWWTIEKILLENIFRRRAHCGLPEFENSHTIFQAFTIAGKLEMTIPLNKVNR